MKTFVKNNIIILAWFPLAFLFEMYGVTFTDSSPILTTPYFLILLLSVLALIQYITNSKLAQLIITSILLVAQVFIITSFIYLYDSNGTYFEWSMVNQRNDGFGTIESLELRLEFLIPALIIAAAFIIGFAFYVAKHKKAKTLHNNVMSPLKKVVSVLLFIFSFTLIGYPIMMGTRTNTDFIQLLYGDNNNPYQEQGITGTIIYEAIKGPTVSILSANSYNEDNVDSFVYSDLTDTSDYFGVSEGNNLVLVLVESFEWYPLTMYSPEVTAQIYPNLYNFMNESIVASNFHAREKTDISEALSVISNYPTGEFINYGFERNAYPFSLPNMFKSYYNQTNTAVKVNSFHNNKATFYNRTILHNSFGFDNFYGIADMERYGVTNYWDTMTRERNLDSEAMEVMKDVMFPTDKPFFTFSLSFTMHGFYNERANLKEQGYYDLFDLHGVFPKTPVLHDNYLRTYAAALKDFDVSLGIMMNDLEQKNILDKTTVVLYSDHNTYYSNLSNYAKGIKDKFHSELYRVPLMIYDEKLASAIDANGGSREITKFTTTSDILPTLLDILGIRGWKNLYFGSSILLDNIESIIYSRAYGIFVTDKFVGFSLNNRKYAVEDFDELYKADFEERAKAHLSKLEFINKIYYTDYFANNPYLEPTQENIILI